MLVAAAGLLLLPAYGQNQNKGGGGTTTTPPNTGGTPGTTNTGRTTSTTNNPTNNTNPNSTQPAIPQPLFVSGRVTLEDGTAPPEPVVIETVCNGMPHGEGYTDTKGYFGVELGSRNSVVQDASEDNTITGMNSVIPSSTTGNPLAASVPGLGANDPERRYMGCDLQAKLVGYRSQQIPLTGRRPLDDPNVGVILLHRMMPNEEGQTISAVSMAAPKDAKKAYDKGVDAIKKKKWDEAEKSFEKAVEAYPKYAAAWYELGMLQMGQSKPDMARSYFKRALECDSKYLKPYLQMAALDMMAKQWQDLADVTEKTVKLDPFSYPQAYFFNSVANYNLHNYEAAEKSGLEAERLDTRHVYPRVIYLLGLVSIQKKDYEDASKRFKAYLKLEPSADDAATVRSQIEAIDKITATSK
jgi:tetratricopeptide (TPR) repeat protein